MPDREHIAVVSHWGFIRGLTGAELHNTDSIRLGVDETPSCSDSEGAIDMTEHPEPERRGGDRTPLRSRRRASRS